MKNEFVYPSGTPERQPGVRWITGSIRRKLTLFVVIILMLVVSLFWFFAVYLLQPAYQRSIRMDLTAAMSTVEHILAGAEEQGIPLAVVVMQNGRIQTRLSDECQALLTSAIEAGVLNLDNRCLEIADNKYRNLYLADNLWPRCFLHPSHEVGVTETGAVQMESEANSLYASRTRRAVFMQQQYETEEQGLLIMGRTVLDGGYSVVVTTSMERIPQAMNVLKGLMIPVAGAVFAVSALATWIFSRWFTRPLSRLSVATREMARGNYDVQVDDSGDDEIAALSGDFNAMAREVKRSADMQRDLIANISHDLRTPLTLIKGYAETVRDLSGDDPPRRTEQLNVIVDEADRLSSLVGSVLELSRVSNGHEKVEPVRFDLDDLCDEIAYRYQAIAHREGYSFVFSGEEGCHVLADPAMVERALHNLIGNAVKHVGPDGYVGLRILKTEHRTVRVEVIDHGAGIAPEDLDHIFDRYYRSRSDAGKQGTGLGLSITKAIFEAQGFQYGVITEQGRGSIFWFEAPLVE